MRVRKTNSSSQLGIPSVEYVCIGRGNFGVQAVKAVNKEVYSETISTLILSGLLSQSSFSTPS